MSETAGPPSDTIESDVAGLESLKSASESQTEARIESDKDSQHKLIIADLEIALDQANKERDKAVQDVSDLRDQVLRTRADFENSRKRILRDKEDSVLLANRQILTDIITVIDDFERAIKSANESNDFDTFYAGIELIERQFIGMLERKWGLKRFEALEEAFDPDRHEAIQVEAKPDTEAGTILEVYQRGYLLHDKIARTAKVKVSS